MTSGGNKGVRNLYLKRFLTPLFSPAYRDDGDAGLLHVGLRYYDPSVGRFITADPLLGDISRPQSLNRYVYVDNNPVNLVDPSGTDWRSVLRAIGALFVIVAIVVLVFAEFVILTAIAVVVLIVVGVGLIIVSFQ